MLLRLEVQEQPGDVLAALLLLVPALLRRHLGADRSCLVPALLSGLVPAVAVFVAFLLSDGIVHCFSVIVLHCLSTTVVHCFSVMVLHSCSTLERNTGTDWHFCSTNVHTLGVQHCRAFLLLLVPALLCSGSPWHFSSGTAVI
jgi:hypothetical protein